MNHQEESPGSGQGLPEKPVIFTTETMERADDKVVGEVLSKYDRESAFRKLTGLRGIIISAVCILFSLIQLYSTWRIIPATHMRPLHVGIVTLLAYLLYPFRRKTRKDTLPWYDILLALASLGLCLYQVVFFQKIYVIQNTLQGYEVILGAAAIVLILEATRRVVGLPIVIIACAFIAIGAFGRVMPGFLGNRGFGLKQLVEHLFYSTEGIFGTPIGASSTFIFLFILFGAFLEKTGVGAFFIDLANTIAGKSRGGPAKVAVLSSALMGTVSGSSVANTVGTGSFTIPMMKRLGYRPEFAAAVEASASTGGQLMPPVMGAAAFLMAESLGIPYSQIVKAAIIPAVLYFSGIYIGVDLEAKKIGLKGLSPENMPRFVKLMLERGYLILPLVAIIFFLTAGFTPSYSALIGIAVAVLGGYFKHLAEIMVAAKRRTSVADALKKGPGMRPMEYLRTLENGARSVLGVALACATAGIIAGMVTMTGIGLKMGAGLTALSGGNLLLLLVFTMFSSILLGMGVPTTANYLITSTIMAPVVSRALRQFLPAVYDGIAGLGSGYAVLPAHLFTFYFGIIADITPPVALAAMAGAAIAKANPLKAGLQATKLAIAAFLVPYIFVYSPQMLMLDAAWYEVVFIAVTALVGMYGVGMAVGGFFEQKLNPLQRLMALTGGLLLIIPGILTDGAGLLLVAAVIVWQLLQKKSRLNAKPA